MRCRGGSGAPARSESTRSVRSPQATIASSSSWASDVKYSSSTLSSLPETPTGGMSRIGSVAARTPPGGPPLILVRSPCGPAPPLHGRRVRDQQRDQTRGDHRQDDAHHRRPRSGAGSDGGSCAAKPVSPVPPVGAREPASASIVPDRMPVAAPRRGRTVPQLRAVRDVGSTPWRARDHGGARRCPDDREPGTPDGDARRGRARRRRHLRRRGPRAPRRRSRRGPRARAGPRPRDPSSSAASSRTTRRRSPGSSPARSASRSRVARRGAGGHRHLQLLPGRGPPALRHDGPERDARQAAVHVPHRRSASAAIVTAGNFPVAVPSWYLVPALLCGNAVVWKPAEYTPAIAEAFAQLFLHAGVPRSAFQMVLADGAATFAGLERALDDGWSTRSGSPARPTSAGGSVSSAAGTCSRRASSSAARTRSS